MARVKPLKLDDIKDKYRDAFLTFSNAFSDFSNQVPIYAHSPEGMKHIFGMVQDMSKTSSLPKRLVEIAIVATSYSNKCSYCIIHHTFVLKGLGLNKSSIASLTSNNPKDLNELELLVYNYAVAVTTKAWGIKDKMFAQLQTHFNDGQIVELTMRIALTGLFNKINQALQIELEEPFSSDAIPQQAP